MHSCPVVVSETIVLLHFHVCRKPYSPVWEETVVINETISSIITPGTIAFFEVLDFLDFSSVSEWSAHTAPVSRDYSGWFKVAWAFLQVCACVCMCACVCACACACVCACMHVWCMCVHACVHVCVCVCMCGVVKK